MPEADWLIGSMKEYDWTTHSSLSCWSVVWNLTPGILQQVEVI